MRKVPIKWSEIKGEHSRTYHFPGGEKVTFQGVELIEVRKSGTHRLETGSGLKVFVRPNWLWLEIVAETWSL